MLFTTVLLLSHKDSNRAADSSILLDGSCRESDGSAFTVMLGSNDEVFGWLLANVGEGSSDTVVEGSKDRVFGTVSVGMPKGILGGVFGSSHVRRAVTESTGSLFGILALPSIVHGSRLVFLGNSINLGFYSSDIDKLSHCH